AASPDVSTWVLIAPLSVYVVDVMRTLMRRALRGERLTEAHREHVYQQIVSLGVSHALAAGTAGLVAALVAISWFSTETSIAMVFTAILLTTYLILPSMIGHYQERR